MSYVEIKIDKYGFAGTTVKVDGRELAVWGLSIDGPGRPKVTLIFKDQTDLDFACDADVKYIKGGGDG